MRLRRKPWRSWKHEAIESLRAYDMAMHAAFDAIDSGECSYADLDQDLVLTQDLLAEMYAVRARRAREET